MIAQGSTVRLEYTLALADGSFVHSNVGQDPVRYVQGEGSLFPALEAACSGRSVDDEFEVQLSAAEAYGPVRAELLQDVPLNQIPEGARQAGTQLRAEDFDGPIRVREIQHDKAVLDFNHPLAGEDLNFKIKILAIEPAGISE